MSDVGKTWVRQTASAGFAGRYLHGLGRFSDSIVVAGGSSSTAAYNDVWVSYNDGKNWTRQTSNGGWTARGYLGFVVYPNNLALIYAGCTRAGYDLRDVWKSLDRGVTWTDQQAVNCPGVNWFPSILLADGSILITGGLVNNSATLSKQVWRSSDLGVNWVQQTSNAEFGVRHRHSGIALPDGSALIMGGYGPDPYLNDVWKTTDAGATWTCLTPAAQWSARSDATVLLLPDGSILLSGGVIKRGTKLHDVWISYDGGVNWVQQTAAAAWSIRYGHRSVLAADNVNVINVAGLATSYGSDVWITNAPVVSGSKPALRAFRVGGRYGTLV